MRGSETRRLRLCSRHGRADATGATPAALARCEAGRSAGWVLCSGSRPSEDIPRRPFRATGGVLVAPGPKI